MTAIDPSDHPRVTIIDEATDTVVELAAPYVDDETGCVRGIVEPQDCLPETSPFDRWAVGTSYQLVIDAEPTELELQLITVEPPLDTPCAHPIRGYLTEPGEPTVTLELWPQDADQDDWKEP